jgi:quinolinate synthase
MAMNGMRRLAHALRTGENEVLVPEDIARRAVVPIKRLLDFSAARQRVVYGNNDA